MRTDLSAPELYVNRELSWLEFNRRVLSLATRADVPVLERLKFIAIAASNLDEFYMVRVGGLRRRVASGTAIVDTGPDAMRPSELLREIGRRAKLLALDTALAFTESVVRDLRKSGVRFVSESELEGSERTQLQKFHEREVHPCLTPIALDPTHPLPHLRNGSLNLALRIEATAQRRRPKPFDLPEGTLLALAQVPSVLPRFVPLSTPSARHAFMALEDVISMFAADLFPGHRILEARAFRVTRASDLDIAEDEADDLLTTIEDELRRRDRGEPVRLEVSSGTSDELMEHLRDMLGLEEAHVHRHPGYVDLGSLQSVYRQVDLPELRDEPFTPVTAPLLRYSPTLFRTISERDVLLHHPYETFRHVVEFIEQAAADPDVLAIKQTLYRTGGDSPVVRALARAAEAGKQVTALIELKARFDEANNIAWARALEESGVHVVYGLIGLKTHAKSSWSFEGKARIFDVIFTYRLGNYNPTTARQYTDLSLFTARDDFTSDALLLFNVLTGYAELPPMQRLIVAPFTLRKHLIDMVAREIEHAKAGRPSGIRAKMNALADPEIIRALYSASQAGVPIDLIVRGICCLRPGINGISNNIRVRALVDRYLEHARIFWWKNGGADEVYLSSADWMPRNFNRRIEVAFPILDSMLKKRIIEEIFQTELSDNTFAWELGREDTYRRAMPAEASPSFRAQATFMRLAKERAAQDRTSVRPELLAPPSTVMSPALRVVEAQSRRKRGKRDELPDR